MALDIRITFAARQRAETLLSSTDVAEPTLCLMKGRASGELEDRWSWGIYGPDNVNYLVPTLADLGHSLLYELDGLTVAIPQFHLVPDLVGGALDVRDGGLVLTRGDIGA